MTVVKESRLSSVENLRLDMDESVLIREALYSMRDKHIASKKMFKSDQSGRYEYLQEYYDNEINKINNLLDGLKNPIIQ